MTNEKNLSVSSANAVQRTASYRLALRRSAPVETDKLLTKANNKTDVQNEAEELVEETNEKNTTITSQPISDNRIKKDNKVIKFDESANTGDTNGNKYLETNLDFDKSLNQSSGAEDEPKTDNGWNCEQFCCEKCCCNYCKCCPGCYFEYKRRLQNVLAHFSDCGLNCLRVFT